MADDLDSLGLSDDEVRQQYPLIARPAPAMQPVSVRGVNIPQVQPEPEAPSMMRSATEIPPVTPTVASPLEQQTAKDRTMQSELSRGSGIAQIGNPWARGALRGLNIAGEIGAAAIPELRPVLDAIPGTEEHHQQLLGRNTAALNEDEAQAEKEAQTGEAGARTGLTNAQTTEVPSTIAKNTAEATEANARAEALKNPKPEKPENLEQELADATQDAIARKVLPVDDPKVRQILGVIEAQKPPGEKTPPHVTVMEKDGKPHIMERDPKTGAYSIDRGVAPPNFAMIAPALQNEKTFLGKEVLAYTPDGRRVQMSYADAQKQGIPAERLIALNPKEAQDTRDKVASIETTFQGLDRYRKDLRDTSPKLSQNERDALRVLTEHTERTAGALGGLLDELPITGPLTDYSNRLLHGTITSDQYKSLSPEGKKLVSDYFTSVIDNFASMKARLGSVGRNPMQLQAEVNTIPLPYLDWESAIPQFENKRLSLSGYASQMPELYSPSK